MIVFNVGTPGSGKSYDAILKIIANLKRRRFVCTNIEGLDSQECQQYLKDLVGMDDFEFAEHFRYLSPAEIMRFWKTEPVTRKIYSPDADKSGLFPAIEETTEELICPVGSLIIIDEVHKYYNARDWQASASRELGDWASTHRHFGYDLVLITQNIDKVDKQVRTLTEWTYFFRKINFLGGMVSHKYIKYSYSGDDHDGKALAKNVATYVPDVFPCYKSYSAADAKEVGFMTHVNILKHPVFFAIPIVLCLTGYMFSKSSFATGDILGSKAIQQRQNKLIAQLQKAPAGTVVPSQVLPSSNPLVAPSAVPGAAPGALAVRGFTTVPALNVVTPMPVVASAPPVWPAAAPAPVYTRYNVDGWINDGGQYIISFQGVSLRLPHPDILRFNRSSNSVLARTDVFGSPVVRSIPVPVAAPVRYNLVPS